jgi:hypothetical protein
VGLTNLLASAATARAHVLVVEAPGRWQIRAALERALTRRGWRMAESPADADALAVCGEPGPELTAVVQRVWDQLPGPRVRLEVLDAGDVESALEEAAAALLDTARHREDPRQRPVRPDLGSDQGDDQGEDHGEHHQADHHDMDMGGEADGGMDMDMAPDGIPLAEVGEDRDGLEMDVLHVRMGPVLPHWPPGLVLRCSLQGDAIVGAEASVVDGYPERGSADAASSTDAATSAARRCDAVAGLLALAGWADAAVQARRARDALLSGEDTADAVLRLERLQRKVARSWLLRWSLRSVRPLSETDLREHGLPTRLRGDTHDRLLAMIAHARALVGETTRPQRDEDVPLTAVPRLVTGLDLATARLVIASLGLEGLRTDQEVAHA